MDAGNAAYGYSFKGPDPHDVLTTLVQTVSLKTYSELVNQHETDYSSVLSLFSLDLGQQPNLDQPTDTIMNNYQTDIGDAYLEWLLFNFGRYLLLGSARGRLPANLQGVWAPDASNPWSADYRKFLHSYPTPAVKLMSMQIPI
jgi:alpha-L-fucosidase 2